MSGTFKILGALAPALLGLATMGAAMFGWAMLESKADAPVDGADAWRPRCTAAYGWAEADVTLSTPDDAKHVAKRGPVVFFGVDASGSNRVLLDTQLDAVGQAITDLPLSTRPGVMVISDQSDHSGVIDLAVQPAVFASDVVVTGVACWPNCEPKSLAGQRCFTQLEDALETRAAGLEVSRGEALASGAKARSEAFATWRTELTAGKADTRTSLLRFFEKVADHPDVRRAPEEATLVVVSDLEETRLDDRRRLDGWNTKLTREGVCPAKSELPRLAGVKILLVQSVTEAVANEAWADRWASLLRCTGAEVERRRFSPAVALVDVLDEAFQVSAGSTNSPIVQSHATPHTAERR
jgi:hypothetical protein